MKAEERIETEGLLEEIKIALKDIFLATVRKKGDELSMQFPNGQKFVLTVWEDKFDK